MKTNKEKFEYYARPGRYAEAFSLFIDFGIPAWVRLLLEIIEEENSFITELEDKADYLSQQVDGLEDDFKRSEKEVEKLNNDLESANDEIDDLKDKLNELESEFEEYRNEHE